MLLPITWIGELMLIQRIFVAIKGSLERLGTDYVDVYQCHRFDKETPVSQVVIGGQG
jgi:aryl-alcohol dehydrogenase-like predicted oxidoreductase